MFRLWFRLSRSMTLGARVVVENEAGHVLLVRHTYTKGLYLPGGGVERGETVHESMQRELEEEGGLALTGQATQIGIFSNHRLMRNDHVILYRVDAGSWTQCGDPIGMEISEIVWCDPLSPPEDATPATQRRLQELYAGAAPSEYW